MECFFDNGDCVCSEGCVPRDFPACPSACLNYKCGFAYFGHEKGCNDSAALKQALSQQVLESNYFASFSPATCLASDESCTSEELASYATTQDCKVCSEELCTYPCNTPQCAFTLGNCYSALHVSCARGFGPERRQCFDCKPGYFLIYSTCVKACPSGFEVNKRVPRLCTPLEDTSSKEKPGVFYVTSAKLEGDGSLEWPFGTLGLAVAAVWNKYAVIYLLGPKVDYMVSFYSEHPEFAIIPDMFDPLSSANFRELTIKSLLCTSTQSPYCSHAPTVIQGFGQMVYFNISSNVTFQDVSFSSADIFANRPFPYCPFITFNQFVEVSAELRANSDLCRQFSSYSVIVVQHSGWLWLKSVQVVNFTMQMFAFININGGNVRLDDVNFTSVQASTRETYAAVILQQSVCSPGRCGSLQYRKGRVSLINNGYEYSDELFLVPFFRGKAVDYVELAELDFRLNMVVESSVGAYGSNKALLYIGNCILLNITNCDFVGNIATGGVIFVDSDIDLPGKSTSISDAQLYSAYRILLHNLHFSYNYANEGIIYISFGGFAGTVELVNCEISHSTAVSESLISLINLGEPLMTVANGQVIEATSAVVLRRNVTIANLKLYGNVNYVALLAVKSLANGQVSDITIEENGFLEGNTVALVFSYYVNSTLTRAVKTPEPDTAICSCAILLHSCAYFRLNRLSFYRNLCAKGGTGLDTFNSQGKLTISELTGYLNTGNYQIGGLLLTLVGVEAELTKLTISQNANSAGAMVALTEFTNATITDSNFIENSGFSGTCILVLAGNQITLQGILAQNNIANNSNGGVLFWQSTGTEPSPVFTVIDSFFEGNAADTGGVFYVNAFTKSALKLNIKFAFFSGNQGFVRASVLFLGPMIEIKPDSAMYNGIIYNNISPTGAVYLMHNKGNFTFIRTIFVQNQGKEASGMALETSTEALIYLVNVYFGLHTLGPTFLVANSRTFTRVISVNVTFRSNEMTDIVMEGGYWEDRQSVYNGSTVAEVVLSSSAVFNVSDGKFLNNFDRMGGSAVRVQTNSTFICVRCTFSNNSAGADGGAVTVEQNSIILLSSCLFTENSAQDNAAVLYVLAAKDRVSVIRDSRFVRNRSGGYGTVFVTAALLVMERVDFEGNYGLEAPGIVLLMGTLWLRNVQFASQTGILAAFLVLFTYSNATIENSSFSHGTSLQGGSMYISSSSLSISNSAFNDVEGGFSGAIYAVSSSEVTLAEVTMLHVASTLPGSLVYLYTSTLTAVNCSFQDFAPTGIVGLFMPELKISNSLFENGLFGALHCRNCLKVTISLSAFSNLTADSGPAVNLHSTGEGGDCQAFLVNLTCRMNRASTGGALWVGNYDLSVTGGRFELNSAENGGAVYLDCDHTRNCIYLVSEAQFFNNSAEMKGGAIAWNHAKPVLSLLIFSGNSAKYGNNVASFPIHLNFDSISHKPPIRLLSNFSSEGGFPDFVSGQVLPFDLTLTLRDHLNQVVATDSVSSAAVEVTALTQALVAGTTKVLASNGTFVFSAFIIYAKPGITVTLSFSTDAVELAHPNDPDPHIAIEKIPVVLRPCQPGEFQLSTGCQVCTKGTFSLSPAENCQSCLVNAICDGKFYIYPVYGFWRSHNMSAIIRPCPNPSACLGGQVEGVADLQGVCAQGYKGNLCQSCAEDYSRTGLNRCGLCPSNDVNIVRLVFVTAAMIILLSLMVWTTLRSSLGPKAIHSILIKILVNYFQLVFLVTQFKLNWPGPVNDLFNAQQEAGGATAQAYSFDCLLQNGSNENPFFTKLIFMSVLPLPLLVIVGLVWLCIALKSRKMIYIHRECKATFVILYFLILPDLVQAFFSLLNCDEIEQGEYWLVADMDIRCWDSTHSLYSLALGIPAIVIWVFAVPLGCLMTLIRNRRQQDELWFKMRYGFLTNGYMRKRYYWEFVILYRKVLIIICSVFLSGTIAVQALTVELILFLFLLLQARVSPYTTKQLNHLELIGIIVADVTIYCGLYFLTDLSTKSSWFFFTVIVVINAVFLLYWVSALLAYALDKFLSHIYVIRTIFHLKERFDPEIEQFLELYRETESCAHFGSDLKWVYRRMAAGGRDLFAGVRKLRPAGRLGNRVEWRRPPSISATHLGK